MPDNPVVVIAVNEKIQPIGTPEDLQTIVAKFLGVPFDAVLITFPS